MNKSLQKQQQQQQPALNDLIRLQIDDEEAFID